MRYINFLVFIFLLNLNANSFEKNCKSCHFQEGQLQMFISRYTLKYSSEIKIKKAIYEYIKNPSKENSVMPRGFLNRFPKFKSEVQFLS